MTFYEFLGIVPRAPKNLIAPTKFRKGKSWSNYCPCPPPVYATALKMLYRRAEHAEYFPGGGGGGAGGTSVMEGDRDVPLDRV